MGKVQMEQKREHGIYYTPDFIAEYLAKPLVKAGQSILDPAYGNGSLLLAAEVCAPEGNLQLYGCDLHPVNGLLKHLPAANLTQADFFEYESDLKFDVVLTNPPYVKHQRANLGKYRVYREQNTELEFLSNSSDLWSYFLVKAVGHLKSGGAMGAIVPWSFLQANYAQNLRLWLSKRFGRIKVLALNKAYFDSTKERVVLLWFHDYQHKNISISYAETESIDDKIEFRELGVEKWVEERVVFSKITDLKSVLTKLVNLHDFLRFGDFATVRIGIVTGANAFFVRTKEELLQLGIDASNFTPLITSAKEFPDYLTNGAKNLKVLLEFADEDNKSKQLINAGVELNLHERSHSRLRHPWYKVNQGLLPDAFFPYRVGHIPYLMLNKDNSQCTNSVHRIYFKNLTEIQKQWIMLSMLSSYSQLSMYVEAKTYGRGMVKMEPNALCNSLVLCLKDRSVSSAYKSIVEQLKVGDKRSAVQMADSFINKKLRIPITLQNEVASTIEELGVF
jgi:adenine-specific DNA-methyltransferase